MSPELTHATMQAYMDALVRRAPFAGYFADDVTFTVMSTGQIVRGRAEVEGFIRYMHEQAFDGHPVVKTIVVGAGHAALEAEFVGTHVEEFQGVPATGKHVQVPYAVVYDLAQGQITALRMYMPMDMLMQQISAPAMAAGAH